MFLQNCSYKKKRVMQYGLNSFACLYSCFMISHNSKFSLPTPYFKFANDYFTECLHHLHFTVNTCDTLREKCPNTELFLVRIFPHSGWIRRDTKYLSVFSPNAGKYGPEVTPYLDIFRAVTVTAFHRNSYQTIRKTQTAY